jgi:hypothetical protein
MFISRSNMNYNVSYVRYLLQEVHNKECFGLIFQSPTASWAKGLILDTPSPNREGVF